MSANQAKQLRELGYEVQPAMFADTDEHATVYRVTGLGLDTLVAEDDRDTLKSLLDGHSERETQIGETSEETMLRHVDKPGVDPGQIKELRQRAKASRRAAS